MGSIKYAEFHEMESLKIPKYHEMGSIERLKNIDMYKKYGSTNT